MRHTRQRFDLRDALSHAECARHRCLCTVRPSDCQRWWRLYGERIAVGSIETRRTHAGVWDYAQWMMESCGMDVHSVYACIALRQWHSVQHEMWRTVGDAGGDWSVNWRVHYREKPPSSGGVEWERGREATSHIIYTRKSHHGCRLRSIPL